MHNVTELRFVRYVKALMKLYSSRNTFHTRYGRRLLPIALVEERLQVCKTCEHFQNNRCALCGCCTNNMETHLNKLAFPTEACPGNKWDVVK